MEWINAPENPDTPDLPLPDKVAQRSGPIQTPIWEQDPNWRRTHGAHDRQMPQGCKHVSVTRANASKLTRPGRIAVRGAILALMLGLVLTTGAVASTPDSTYPHMPTLNGQVLWGTKTATDSYVKPAMQWTRTPVTVMALDLDNINNAGAATDVCVRKYGAAICTPPPGMGSRQVYQARLYPVTPAKPLTASRFDTFPPMTVRTVAFGSVPAEATIALTLPHDSDGLPKPLTALAGIDQEYTAGGDSLPEIVHDTDAGGEVNVRISALSTDGVPVAIGAGCRTSRPAVLTLHGSGFSRVAGGVAGPPPPGHYDPANGGLLTGTLDVPPFTGCGTRGQDLDPLVNAMASGSGFPVQVQQGLLGTCWYKQPAMIDPSSCPEPADLPFPTRP